MIPASFSEYPSDPPQRGRLIAIEGIDGAGKTTLARALAAALEARGVPVLVTSEPTHGKYGMQVRAMASSGRDEANPERELQLFTLDRREHVENEIKPALAAGKTVILDRYFYSTMAYQGARGLDPKKIERENLKFAPEPDLLVLLDLPVEVALERIVHKRGSIPDHFEGAEYLQLVRDLYKRILGRHAERRRRTDALQRDRAALLQPEVEQSGMLWLDAQRTTEEMLAELLARLA